MPAIAWDEDTKEAIPDNAVCEDIEGATDTKDAAKPCTAPTSCGRARLLYVLAACTVVEFITLLLSIYRETNTSAAFHFLPLAMCLLCIVLAYPIRLASSQAVCFLLYTCVAVFSFLLYDRPSQAAGVLFPLTATLPSYKSVSLVVGCLGSVFVCTGVFLVSDDRFAIGDWVPCMGHLTVAHMYAMYLAYSPLEQRASHVELYEPGLTETGLGVSPIHIERVTSTVSLAASSDSSTSHFSYVSFPAGVQRLTDKDATSVFFIPQGGQQPSSVVPEKSSEGDMTSLSPKVYSEALLVKRRSMCVSGRFRQAEVDPGSCFESIRKPTLQKIIALFNSLNDEADLFHSQQIALSCVCDLVGCERSELYLVDHANKRLYMQTENNSEMRIPMAGTLAGFAVETEKTHYINDVKNDARFRDMFSKATMPRDVLVVPILGKDCVVSVVVASNKQKGFFCKQDGIIMELIGKQVGIHATTIQMYNKLADEAFKTSIFLELSRDITDVQLDMDQMMCRIMSKARLVLKVERATIFLTDHEKNELWSILIDSETAETLNDVGNIIRVPVGVGLAGHTAETGEILNISDVQSSHLFNGAFDKRTGFVTESCLCVPIFSRSVYNRRNLGVMQFINKKDSTHFDTEDEQAASSFSSFVGMSINNHLLFEEQKEGKLVREQNKMLMKLKEEAQQAAEAKSNFLMAMSHEIRTPMSGVIGMAEILMSTNLTEEQLEVTRTIQNCADALMCIINDILDIGKIDAGKLILERIPFRTAVVFEDAINVFRFEAHDKGLALTLDISPHLPLAVEGDAYRLRQVVVNLLGNAVKFTPQGENITLQVDAEPVQDGIVVFKVKVADTGIGIAKNKISALFNPFEQEDTGTTRQYGGSGLGLSICKKLVTLMEGTVGVISKKGKGSEFWFTCRFFSVENQSTIAENHRFKGTPRIGMALADNSVLQKLCSSFGAEVVVLDDFKAVTEIQAIDIFFIDDKFLTEHPASLAWVTENKNKVCLCLMRPSMISKHFNYVLLQPLRLSILSEMVMSMMGETYKRKTERCSSIEALFDSPCSGAVLVAEDNRTNQLLITKQLKKFNIMPTLCDNGREAIDALKRKHHPLIFMDCHMPVLDGYSATAEIRRLEKERGLSGFRPPVTIIALTADVLPNTRDMCLSSGMNDYLSKPLRIEQLQEVLLKYSHALQHKV